ncbi:GNAT family N-acetyltransferase [Planomonospora sp. ID91781]|uniref:N-acetyltransferase GCN5 n=1 Tax=Planomonospora sphaerica TaxID=161355 RepID=A0A161LH90_9ACTN|nr:MULTISPECIES: GNAT family N-acetyltransferase [Planomonospora]MBG0821441.1 GNAT family N-acetyltransferase [Planomonospora sp. ID91781]GAT66984.1 N-acetyltransferase GCN5 [Planomonospora sphaerica]
MLRTTASRVLDDNDRDEVLALLDTDPVANVFVASRVRSVGLNPARLGGQMWGFGPRGGLTSLCYAGANLVPVHAGPEAVHAFADRARRQGRRCSSIVGPADAVEPLWERLEPYWGPARAVRWAQPLMATAAPSPIPSDPLVRRVRPEEFETLFPACVAMFTEEVGISPEAGDGGALYRSRVAELIRIGRSYARIDDGTVVFKAEIGAVTPQACQIQGVWVDPAWRGRGHAATGMAAVVEQALACFAPVVSLYVNDYNAPARAAYRKAGFTEVGTFMSVLF